MFRKRLLEKSGDEPTTTAPLIPYGLVEGWLNNSRLVEAMAVNPYEVYKNILDVIPEWKRCTTSVVQNIKREPDCSECRQGYLVLDATEASSVCNYCGVVDRQRLNIEREYIKPVEDIKGKERTVPGVSKWVVGMIHGRTEKDYTSIFEHWNTYAYLSVEELGLAVRLMTHIKWSGHNNEETHICALLLAPRLEMMNEDEFRMNISKAHTLAETKKVYEAIDPTPRPQAGKHVCAKCGVSCFRARDALFHCKWKHNATRAKPQRKF